ncbi:anti-sigma factor family protein [Streptomyces formicae]|uniref:Zf-HC2 domain-containing protein n=1 Tax=Streptomyces formicae TaxID=1616117 RepID=A0ABY3X0G0_9ACTN|nr:anti-sigma factor [Streptomyces formicae]UNM16236.1 zf-HC2 domain-containing protein [Streptomyces formicae]
MTSTTGTAQHPDVSEISDLTEGLLSPTRQAAVRAHLEECPLCAEVRASLEEIRGLLGTLPGPPRMPADIAGRLDAALAAEALLNATAPHDEPEHVSRETSPAEPAGSGHLDRPAGRPRAATGPGRGNATRRRRRTALLGAAFGVAALGVSVVLLQSANTDGGDAMKAESGVSAADTSADFSEEGLQARVHTLLAADATAKGDPPDAMKSEPRVETGSSADTKEGPASPMRTATAPVPPCVQKGTGRSDPALAAEPGTYKGTTAYLVVLPHPTDGTRVQAYVVDAACIDSAPSSKGKLLLTHAYSRP